VKLVAAVLSLVFASLGAQAIELEGTLVQGGLVIGRVTPGSSVTLDGAAVHVDPQRGLFVIGFGRDHAPHAELGVATPDGKRETVPLSSPGANGTSNGSTGCRRAWLRPVPRSSSGFAAMRR
jgi:hypothetical protein